MKLIAVSQRLVEVESHNEIRDALDVRWSGFLLKAGLVPLILPSGINPELYLNQFNVQGILHTGGNDLGRISKSGIDSVRDNYEKQLISFAIEHRIPVMGVCRGMQVISEFFGSNVEPVKNHTRVRHELVINDDHEIAVKLSGISDVNSYHNYGVTKAPDSFTIIAKNNDEVIEAMHHTKLKVYAQMWHPERENPFCENDIKLVRNFFTKESS